MTALKVTPSEAEETLAAIQDVSQRTRRSIAGSSAYVFLLVTGSVWLVGFLFTQFLSGPVLGAIWGGLGLLATVVSVLLGVRMGRRLRSPSAGAAGRRIALLWLIMMSFCAAALAVARPADGRQLTMIIVLFIMAGQLCMGVLVSFSSVWWALPITALALGGYFLLPGMFYLWMALLVGGGMILFAFHIRSRW